MSTGFARFQSTFLSALMLSAISRNSHTVAGGGVHFIVRSFTSQRWWYAKLKHGPGSDDSVGAFCLLHHNDYLTL